MAPFGGDVMIRSQMVLLRIAEEFFRNHLVGLYAWDRVKISPPERRPPIPPNIPFRERRNLMAEREGKGKWLEQERLAFGPWEILIYSAQEKGPLGEVTLRGNLGDMLVTGPLDPATWAKIGDYIRNSHQRKAS
jgi:hypothetical protein